MTPHSLPGFLRRTIRNDSDEDSEQDQVQSDAIGTPASKSLMINVSTSLKKNTAFAASTSSASSGGTNTDAEESSALDVNVISETTEDFQNIDRKFRMMSTARHTKQEPISRSSRGSMSQNAYGIPDSNSLPGNNGNPNAATELDNTESLLPSSTESRRKPRIPQNESERVKSYKDIQFDKIILSPVVDIDDLRKLAWNGIPVSGKYCLGEHCWHWYYPFSLHWNFLISSSFQFSKPEHRPQTWKILLGYIPTNTSRRLQTLKRKRSEYRDAIAQHYEINDHSRTTQEQETLRQVLVDVPRTAPDVPLFRNDMIRQSLARLLYIWAMRHPASSYVQGINDLATPLFAVFLSEYFDGDVLQGEELEDLTPEILNDVEADVYWCLTNLLAGIQDHYTQDQPGVQRMVMRLEELVKRIDAGLTGHLETTGVQFIQFAFRWMNCLLLREFNLKCIIRLWDTYLSEGDGGFEIFHVYVCASFLCQFSEDLQVMQFDELFAFMQNIPTSDWDDSKIEIVLSQAFVLSTLFQGSDAHLMSSANGNI